MPISIYSIGINLDTSTKPPLSLYSFSNLDPPVMDLGPYLACDGVNYQCTMNDSSAVNLHFTPIKGRYHDINGVKGVARFLYSTNQLV
jgi:hypothetical protein